MSENGLIFSWTAIGVIAVFIIVLGIFGQARAGECEGLDWRIGQLVGSEHNGSKGVTNEDHKDSFYGCIEGWCAGKYENSYSTPRERLYSRFVGRTDALGSWGPLDFNIVYGVVDGYRDITTHRQLIPMAGLTVKMSLLKGWQMGKASIYGWEFGCEDWEAWQ